MKRILTLTLFIFISFIFIGCNDNEWQIRQNIKPEILKQNDNVLSVKYKLGPLLVLDDITFPNTAQAIYFVENKDKFELQLVVMYEDILTAGNGFYYYFANTKVGNATNPIDLKNLQELELEIDGFEWIIKDSVDMKQKKISKDETPKTETPVKQIEEPTLKRM